MASFGSTNWNVEIVQTGNVEIDQPARNPKNQRFSEVLFNHMAKVAVNKNPLKINKAQLPPLCWFDFRLILASR
jgi:hypothetical protein